MKCGLLSLQGRPCHGNSRSLNISVLDSGDKRPRSTHPQPFRRRVAPDPGRQALSFFLLFASRFWHGPRLSPFSALGNLGQFPRPLGDPRICPPLHLGHQHQLDASRPGSPRPPFARVTPHPREPLFTVFHAAPRVLKTTEPQPATHRHGTRELFTSACSALATLPLPGHGADKAASRGGGRDVSFLL